MPCGSPVGILFGSSPSPSHNPRILDLAHFSAITSIPWDVLVVDWGNQAALVAAPIQLAIHIILSVDKIIKAPRLWLFSKKNLILVRTLAWGCIGVFAVMVFRMVKTGSTSNPFNFQNDIPELVLTFSIVAGGLILMHSKWTSLWHLPWTNFVVARIIQYTVAMGLTSSVGAGTGLRREHYQSFHFSLGHMYTNALFTKILTILSSSLNSRTNLRVALGTGIKEDHNISGTLVFFIFNQVYFVSIESTSSLKDFPEHCNN
ncbi:hypothetical protein DFH08DRAFT_808051 [Mycena albidolilacea]|uniref:Uncharacterized protein n=1 Tax=Mycena albidolilacea TaxID=1033008 RepID=A0AAD7ESZ1_9AGAR|nr:hypothetical protein DFH08DRAFT_808051 [Mycena albidolilacea]